MSVYRTHLNFSLYGRSGHLKSRKKLNRERQIRPIAESEHIKINYLFSFYVKEVISKQFIKILSQRSWCSHMALIVREMNELFRSIVDCQQEASIIMSKISLLLRRLTYLLF